MAARKFSHKRLGFLYNLHDLLTTESGKQNPIACWVKDLPLAYRSHSIDSIQNPNCAFVILDEKAFVDALDVDGRGAKSFPNKCRTLSNWCFDRLSRTSWLHIFVSRQPYFNVGNRHEIEKMVSVAPSLDIATREKREKEAAARRLAGVKTKAKF